MTKQENLLETSDNALTNLKVIILLNLAAVKLKERNYRGAMEHCDEVSKYSNKVIKQFISRFNAQCNSGLEIGSS